MPQSIEADVGFQIGGGIEILGEDSVGGGGLQLDILLIYYLGSVLSQSPEDSGKMLVISGCDADQRRRGVVFVPTHLEVKDVVIPASLQDVVKHAR